MEKAPVQKLEHEPPIVKENNRTQVTKRILSRLALWGMISLGPLGAGEAKTPDINSATKRVMQQAQQYEESYKQAGLLETKKNEKPVVAIMSKEELERDLGGATGDANNVAGIAGDILEINLIRHKKIDVANRDKGIAKKILDEAKLGSEGLINPDQQLHLGHWKPADYYVVSSTEQNKEGYLFTNTIINMKNGSVEHVTVLSQGEFSESIGDELSSKTEKALEYFIAKNQ